MAVNSLKKRLGKMTIVWALAMQWAENFAHITKTNLILSAEREYQSQL